MVREIIQGGVLRNRIPGSPSVKVCVVILSAAVFLLQGCASHKVNDVIAFKTKTAIKVNAQDGESLLNIPGTGRLAGAGRGAKLGAVNGAGLGVFCYLAAPVCIPVFGTLGALGGSVYGMAKADSQSEWKKTEDLLIKIINETDVDARLTDEIIRYANTQGVTIESPMVNETYPADKDRYNYLKQEGFAELIDIKALSVLLIAEDDISQIKPLRHEFEIQAQVVHVDVATGKVIDERMITDRFGVYHNIEAWADENGKLFRDELSDAISRMSVDLVTEYFFLYKLPVQTKRGFMFNAYITGLEAYQPPLRSEFNLKNPVKCGSLQPTLIWAASPFNNENVTYELKIWKASGKNPDELICYKKDIKSNSYIVESELLPYTKYFWSVRARIVGDNFNRVTEWSKYSLKPSEIFSFMTLWLSNLPPYPVDNSFYECTTEQ